MMPSAIIQYTLSAVTLKLQGELTGVVIWVSHEAANSRERERAHGPRTKVEELRPSSRRLRRLMQDVMCDMWAICKRRAR